MNLLDLLENFDKLNNKLTDLLEENKNLKQEFKNTEAENQTLIKKLNERDILQEENKELKEKLKVREKDYKILQKENKELKERDKQFQQQIQSLEKQKNEQLKIISQKLERTLGKLEPDEVNDNDNDNFQDIEDSSDDSQSPSLDKIKVVVGLDFGATYSGFAYCHVSDANNIYTNDTWPGEIGIKTNTVLLYDSDFKEVVAWGRPALSKRPRRRNNNKNETIPVELFKLHLGDLNDDLKPILPVGFKKAITDYLREIGKVIKERVSRWSNIDFCENVLLVLTVPAEYSEIDKAIMRECVFNAGLIREKHSGMLQFTTEHEATAIYCMSLQEHDPLTIETTFMIVDCSGGTVDLTVRKLIGNQLSEVTERVGDFCGSTFVDKEFVKILRKKLGTRAIDLLIENHYDQYQYMIGEFCRRVKLPFTGNDTGFCYGLDIGENAPSLLHYVSVETRETMEDEEWIIDIRYNDIKNMFDPIVDRIIRMIDMQFSNTQEICSVIFLVGDFSESVYLQKRIKQEFQHRVNNVSVPCQPMATISRGAVLYGLSLNNPNDACKNRFNNQFVLSQRILKYNYGVKVRFTWVESDPIERKLHDGSIDKFCCLARRGTKVDVNQEFTYRLTLEPFIDQTSVDFEMYYTTKRDAMFCDEPEVEFLGKLTIDPDSGLGSMLIGVTFGVLKITFTAKNELSGQYYMTTLNGFD